MSVEETLNMEKAVIALSMKLDSLELSNRNWLTPIQLADYLGLSVNTVYQYVSKAKIPFHKIPRSSKLIFSRKEIDHWVEGDESGADNNPIEIVGEIWKSVV